MPSENLKKAEDIQRNISIRAIEHNLTARSSVEMVCHEVLVTRMLCEVILYDSVNNLSAGSTAFSRHLGRPQQ